MELEKQVCSLELAKKLKELGVKQESLWYWWGKTSGCGSPASPTKKEEGHYLRACREIQILCNIMSCSGAEDRIHVFSEKYSAFTVAELGEMLKREALPYWDNVFMTWSCGIYGSRRNILGMEKILTEADARAKMLIYLLEHNLIKVEKGE